MSSNRLSVKKIVLHYRNVCTKHIQNISFDFAVFIFFYYQIAQFTIAIDRSLWLLFTVEIADLHHFPITRYKALNLPKAQKKCTELMYQYNNSSYFHMIESLSREFPPSVIISPCSSNGIYRVFHKYLPDKKFKYLR
jgi:hypothetical protein